MTDGPLLACVPAPCSQMERRLLASPPPQRAPETSPALFQGEGKLELQTFDPPLECHIFPSGLNAQEAQGLLRGLAWASILHPFAGGEGLVCPAWGGGNIRVALEFEASPPPQKRTVVSDKGFEVNKVLKASPVVHPYWGFPFQLV